MKRFIIIWILILAGLSNYSRISESCTEPLIKDDQGIVPEFHSALSEELFTIPPDGTIFVSQTEDHLLKFSEFSYPYFH